MWWRADRRRPKLAGGAGAVWVRASDFDRQLLAGFAPTAPATPFDWSSPDFCLSAGFAFHPEARRKWATSRLRASRPHVEGPFLVPSFNFAGAGQAGLSGAAGRAGAALCDGGALAMGDRAVALWPSTPRQMAA
ncbi:MAG: hypothetical protein R2911_19350 [Caldilineaceae bacterium]